LLATGSHGRSNHCIALAAEPGVGQGVIVAVDAPVAVEIADAPDIPAAGEPPIDQGAVRTVDQPVKIGVAASGVLDQHRVNTEAE